MFYCWHFSFIFSVEFSLEHEDLNCSVPMPGFWLSVNIILLTISKQKLGFA